MLASKLIEHLQAAIAEHGDQEVKYYYDLDYATPNGVEFDEVENYLKLTHPDPFDAPF